MTERYDKFRPPADLPEYHEPFWNSLREHEIRLQKCNTCGVFRFIPTEICPRCWSDDATWAPISGVGSIYTFTVVHRAPTPQYQRDAPYVIAHVDLEEGPRMMGNVVGIAFDEVRIGLDVRIDYFDVDESLTLYRFVAV